MVKSSLPPAYDISSKWMIMGNVQSYILDIELRWAQSSGERLAMIGLEGTCEFIAD